MADDIAFKSSNVTLLYSEDPVNDPGGGWKNRSRPLNKSYRTDLPQLANAWMCVSGPDGTGTYKIQQKDLTKISPNCWMLVGQIVSEDHWTSARCKVGDYLELNGEKGWPDVGPLSFTENADGEGHIANPGSAWAYPGQTLEIGVVWNEAYPEDEMIFQWNVNSGPATITAGADAPIVDIKFTGVSGEFVQVGVKVQHKVDINAYASNRLTIMGQNPKSKGAGGLGIYVKK